MRQIIGISGPKGSGKDSVADVLVENFGYTKVSFADPLKEILANSTQFTIDDFNNQEIKEKPISELIPGLIGPYQLLPHEVTLIIENIEENFDLYESEKKAFYTFFENTEFNTLRDLMQKFGTDLCRNQIEDELWLTLFDLRVQEGIFVCADARFTNERTLIKHLGGILILTTRDTENDNRFKKDSHISENELGNPEDYDVIVDNNGTKSNLKMDVVLWHKMRFPKLSKTYQK